MPSPNIGCVSGSRGLGSFEGFGCLRIGERSQSPKISPGSQFFSPPWLTPEDGAVLSPWVKVVFHDPGTDKNTKGTDLGDITVSNQSSPSTNPQHVAVITRFEFGYTDGMAVKITIQDQQGGSFHKFMENCVKHFACLDASAGVVQMKFSFGWTKAGCSQVFKYSSSPCYYSNIISIETSYSEGKFVFEVTGNDAGTSMLEGGADLIYGGEGQHGVPLAIAIRELMVNGPPPNVSEVRFLKYEMGSCSPCKFEEGGFNGPKGKWMTEGQDKLRAVMRWLERHRTEKKRAWKPSYNFEVAGGEIIFWEDRTPQCKAEADSYWDENSVGTYIVNGSKFSPVLEFAPKIRWGFSYLQSVGGGLSSDQINSMGEEGAKNPGGPCETLNRENNPGAGHMAQTTPTDTERDMGRSQRDSAAADSAAMRANRLTTDDIEADLTVIGDPMLMPARDAGSQKNCSIILINPYFILPQGDGCGNWLANPVCNPILSNKAWQIQSITHRIEASSSFTTTLSLHLPGPGQQLDTGEPLGGWAGGWRPTSIC